MRKKTHPREVLFVRIRKGHKEFIEKETSKVKRETGKIIVTHGDTIERVISGYRALKKAQPRLAAKYF